MPKYGLDYVLRWPLDIFVRECREIARVHNSINLHDGAQSLLEEALSGPQPVRDLAGRRT